VRLLALLLCSICLCFGQVRDGNFDIRFEPAAKLQTGVEIPFQITVQDALHKPLPDAKVTLQIETTDHQNVKVFSAPGITAGSYVAKPLFPIAGQWNVSVEVRRGDLVSARTIQFSVSD